jgi:general secretion pathway protein H
MAGLTLLELMMVLAVLGMASAAVSLAFRDPNAGQVEEEALRLASLLESARAHSRSTGLPVRWQVSSTGFVFEGLTPPQALPQTWKHGGMQAQVQGGEVLLLGPEPVIAPQSVVVFSGAVPAFRWQVATDGVRPFGVQPAPSQPEAR